MAKISKTGPAVVRLSGDLDLSGKAALERALRSQGEGTALIVDLRAVSFIDSTALTVLIDSHKRASLTEGSVRLIVGQDQQVFRILQITGLTQLFKIFSTEAAAARG